MSQGGTRAVAGTPMCGLVAEMWMESLLCVHVSFLGGVGGRAIFWASSIKQLNGPGNVV